MLALRFNKGFPLKTCFSSSRYGSLTRPEIEPSTTRAPVRTISDTGMWDVSLVGLLFFRRRGGTGGLRLFLTICERGREGGERIGMGMLESSASSSVMTLGDGVAVLAEVGSASCRSSLSSCTLYISRWLSIFLIGSYQGLYGTYMVQATPALASFSCLVLDGFSG